MSNRTTQPTGELQRDRSMAGATSRRWFLRSTVGAGVLLAGVGAGIAGGAEVTGTTIDAGMADPGAGTNEATIWLEDGTVYVDGRIPTSHPCHTAELGDVRVENDTLFVVVVATPVPTFAPCEQVLANVGYQAEMDVDQSPSTVVVEHQSMENWKRTLTFDAPDGPEVITWPASTVGARSATLEGTTGSISTETAPWELSFQYRPVGSEWWTSTGSGSWSVHVEYSEQIAGLQPETTYEYRAVAVDANGRVGYGGTETVTTMAATDTPVSPIDGTLPRDLDGDGRFEDLNGNNRTDSDDVVTYFEHMDSPAMTNHSRAFDYNGNDRIDFDDVVALFEML